jgi:hypothetical protein
LAALILMGMFCPVLDQVPARIVYWALIGYGWSYLADGLPSRPFTFAAKALAGGALAALACLHLSMRTPQLLSERQYVKALAASATNPKAYTNLLVEALRLNPANEEANYGYVGVLTEFRREAEAVKLVGFIQGFAPDGKKRDETLARVYASLGRYDSSAKYSSAILGWYPNHLPAMEILMEAYAHQGRCRSVDSLRGACMGLEGFYAMPPSQEYTIHGLDSLFTSNRDVLFLQRWFGGTGLRKRFVEKRLSAYNQRYQNHIRLRDLKETRCLGGAPDSLDASPARKPSRPRMLFRGWG